MEIKQSAVLIVSIGPVQGFIATARRSRDLRFSSWLLSDMTRAAAMAIRDHGGEIVYPAGIDSDDPVANKIVAIVPDGPLSGRAAAESVHHRIDDLSRRTLEPLSHWIDMDMARAQILDLPEVVWASATCDPDYATARRRAERLLAARKGLRDFAQPSWATSAPKSSLDGARESVLDESIYPGPGASDEVRARFEATARRLGIRPGERLCGPGLLKRHGDAGGGSFLSTSSFAAAPVDRRLRREHATERTEYLATLRECGIETDGTRVDPIVFIAEQLDEVLNEPTRAETARRALDRLFAETHVSRPVPYYALLAADGDRMGALIDGLDSPERHRDLSKALARFARVAGEIVVNAGGGLIYAGGDDMLAFLPLDTALSCSQELAVTFTQTLAGFGSGESGPTLSAGLSVAHYSDPLEDALDRARRAEREAKERHGRKAVHVSVSKRSGSETGFGGRWGEADRALARLALMHVRDEVPDGFAYQLRDLVKRLSGPRGPATDEFTDVLRSAVSVEAERLLGRKRSNLGKDGLDASASEVLRELLASRGASGLSDALIVSRMFADVCLTAGTIESLEKVVNR